MNESDRIELIRSGNEAFNNKDYARARELFGKASYQSGLIRLGDYYMYERRLPLLAYGYYKKAGAKAKIEDLQRRMVCAFSEWVGKDKFKPEAQAFIAGPALRVEKDQEGQVIVPVSPLLRQKALEILNAG